MQCFKTKLILEQLFCVAVFQESCILANEIPAHILLRTKLSAWKLWPGVKLHIGVGYLGEMYKHRDHLAPCLCLLCCCQLLWAGFAARVAKGRQTSAPHSQPCSADRAAGQELFWPVLSIGWAASKVWVAASWHLVKDKSVKHSRRTKLFLFPP